MMERRRRYAEKEQAPSGSWDRASSHALSAGKRCVVLGISLRRTARALVVREEAGIRVRSEALPEMMRVMCRCFSRSLRDMYSRTGACHSGMTSGSWTPLREGETGEEIMFLVTRRWLTPLKDDVDMEVNLGALGSIILYVQTVD